MNEPATQPGSQPQVSPAQEAEVAHRDAELVEVAPNLYVITGPGAHGLREALAGADAGGLTPLPELLLSQLDTDGAVVPGSARRTVRALLEQVTADATVTSQALRLVSPQAQLYYLHPDTIRALRSGRTVVRQGWYGTARTIGAKFAAETRFKPARLRTLAEGLPMLGATLVLESVVSHLRTIENTMTRIEGDLQRLEAQGRDDHRRSLAATISAIEAAVESLLRCGRVSAAHDHACVEWNRLLDVDVWAVDRYVRDACQRLGACKPDELAGAVEQLRIDVTLLVSAARAYSLVRVLRWVYAEQRVQEADPAVSQADVAYARELFERCEDTVIAPVRGRVWEVLCAVHLEQARLAGWSEAQVPVEVVDEVDGLAESFGLPVPAWWRQCVAQERGHAQPDGAGRLRRLVRRGRGGDGAAGAAGARAGQGVQREAEPDYAWSGAQPGPSPAEAPGDLVVPEAPGDLVVPEAEAVGARVVETPPGVGDMPLAMRWALPWVCERGEVVEVAVAIGRERSMIAQVVDSAARTIGRREQWPQWFVLTDRRLLELSALEVPTGQVVWSLERRAVVDARLKPARAAGEEAGSAGPEAAPAGGAELLVLTESDYRYVEVVGGGREGAGSQTEAVALMHEALARPRH